jgi:hypothetical protein
VRELAKLIVQPQTRVVISHGPIIEHDPADVLSQIARDLAA